MDHNYAKDNRIAEGYVLNDLSPKERDEYEEHYFSCPLCAEEVKAASDFIINAKQVIQAEAREKLYRETKRQSMWGSWLNWRSIMQPLPAMACFMVIFLGGLSTYQGRTLRKIASTPVQGITTNQMHDSKIVMVKESRGGEPAPDVVHRGQPFKLQVVIPPSNADSYHLEVINESGAVKYAIPSISKSEASNPVELQVPPGVLESGKYILVIQGITSDTIQKGVKGEPVRFSFQLNVQD